MKDFPIIKQNLSSEHATGYDDKYYKPSNSQNSGHNLPSQACVSILNNRNQFRYAICIEHSALPYLRWQSKDNSSQQCSEYAKRKFIKPRMFFY